MNGKVSNGIKGSGSFIRPRMRAIGRIALWAVVALLLIRGAGAVLTSSDSEPKGTSVASTEVALDDSASALVVQFARAYFSNPGPAGLAEYMADPVSPPIRASRSPGQKVAQAEIVETSWISQTGAITVVACELADGRVLHLAVPLTRTESGQVAVLGAPYLVPEPDRVGVAGEDTEPVSGPDAGTIDELVGKFLAAYVSTERPADLSYFLTPESSIRPLGGFTLGGSPRTTQLDEGLADRTVIAAVRLVDQTTRSSYPVGYRLDLVKRERWYVDGVVGVAR